MTPEQYERWKDFAFRMARTCFQANRRPNSRWIMGVVEDFFDYFDEDDIPCIVNWDNSVEYPEGNPRRRREYHTTYCCCDGKRHTRPDADCPECHGSGVHYPWIRPYGIGDQMSEFLDGYQGYPPSCQFCTGLYDRLTRTPGVSELSECRCNEIDRLYTDQWDEQWGGPVRCCVRAGLDFASEPSAGVLGFTAGDLRRMYPEGVPDWVFPPDEQLRYFMSNELNGTFADLPDSAGVML